MYNDDRVSVAVKACALLAGHQSVFPLKLTTEVNTTFKYRVKTLECCVVDYSETLLIVDPSRKGHNIKDLSKRDTA